MAHNVPAQEPLEITTLSDLTTQVLSNAQSLYPKEKNLKVVTAQTSSGLIYYCSVLADDPLPNYPSLPAKPKVLMKGAGAVGRRLAVIALLEETERRVLREVLKVGGR